MRRLSGFAPPVMALSPNYGIIAPSSRARFAAFVVVFCLIKVPDIG
jgi:hypothetical protein